MNGTWRSIQGPLLVALITALVTIMGMWFLTVRDTPSRAEVVTLIATTAPYVQDRSILTRGVQDNSIALERQGIKLDEISLSLARLDERLKRVLEAPRP